MNTVFRIVWNQSLQRWIVASELAKSRSKSSSRTVRHGRLVARAKVVSVLGLMGCTHLAYAEPAAMALPTGGQVVAGQAAIQQSAAHMSIDQGSDRAAIDWSTFDIGEEAQVDFNQPSAAS